MEGLLLHYSYAIHIILQSIEVHELQEQCYTLLGHVLDKLEPLSPSASILGDQLQVFTAKGMHSPYYTI
jgi:hypothetical protein